MPTESTIDILNCSIVLEAFDTPRTEVMGIPDSARQLAR